jgi:hypothetical protein
VPMTTSTIISQPYELASPFIETIHRQMHIRKAVISKKLPKITINIPMAVENTI